MGGESGADSEGASSGESSMDTDYGGNVAADTETALGGMATADDSDQATGDGAVDGGFLGEYTGSTEGLAGTPFDPAPQEGDLFSSEDFEPSTRAELDMMDSESSGTRTGYGYGTNDSLADEKADAGFFGTSTRDRVIGTGVGTVAGLLSPVPGTGILASYAATTLAAKQRRGPDKSIGPDGDPVGRADSTSISGMGMNDGGSGDSGSGSIRNPTKPTVPQTEPQPFLQEGEPDIFDRKSTFLAGKLGKAPVRRRFLF